ncbi:MAG: single-stranded DNA-binding protein [Candidatus Eisenbacteria sp.]|nr:single-stranded DNA-binding protein [Candidatus Eisenbacteria bacterium]
MDYKMPYANKLMMSGRLVRDPEVRYTQSGLAVANMTIVCSKKYKDKDGAWQEQTAFVPCVLWKRWAELAGEQLSKGSPVLVEGHLQSRSWETKEGARRSVLELKVEWIQFLERAQKEPAAEGGSEAATGSSPEGGGENMNVDDVPF